MSHVDERDGCVSRVTLSKYDRDSELHQVLRAVAVSGSQFVPDLLFGLKKNQSKSWYFWIRQFLPL